MAKNSINITWRSYIVKHDIKLSDKLKLYKAVCSAIMTYAAQVWGYIPLDEVDKLFRFFVKKLLGLPSNTPNYMIHLETGMPLASMTALKMHFKYIIKVLSRMTNNRLPKILADIVVEKRISWYNELCNLADKHGVTVNLSSLSTSLDEILTKETEWSQNGCLEQARLSVRHDLYCDLEHILNDSRSYFNDNYSLKIIKFILMCRGGLLWLNANPFRNEGTSMCSICNLGREEDMSHFIGICPIFKNYRLQFLGSELLSRNEVIDLLNGKNWNALFGYCSGAFKLRKILIEEYNA